MFQATTTQKKKTKQNKHPFYLLLFYFLNLCIGCLIAIVTLLSPTSFVRQEFQSKNLFFNIFSRFVSTFVVFPYAKGKKEMFQIRFSLPITNINRFWVCRILISQSSSNPFPSPVRFRFRAPYWPITC